MSGVGGLDRRTVLVTITVVIALGILAPLAASAGASPDAGLYRVGVDETNPYYQPITSDSVFSVKSPSRSAFARGDLELLVRGDEIRVRNTPKGRAAAAELKAVIERYNDRVMRAETDQAAAFPVTVQLKYVERDVGVVLRSQSNGNSVLESGPDASRDREAVTGASTGEPDDSAAATGDTTPADDQSPRNLLPFDGSAALLGRTAGTPSQVSPPFPFVSLVLAFAFIVPMNFVIQAYASSILHERGNRRGELLLITPLSRWAIIAGKTLPYFVAMMSIAALTALGIGGGIISLAAIVPIALLFLACAFVGALLARSHKELTFVLVTVSVLVTTYAFVPAIFTQVHPIAAISPLSLVVNELEGATVSLRTYLFSTGPVFVASATLFGLGSGLYREEDLFTQRRLPAKMLDALAGPIRSPRSAGVLSLASIPFVLLAELMVVAVLFILPLQIAIPLLFVLMAIIEETAKSLHVYAGFERSRYSPTLRTAAIVGGWSGLGFFLGEKAAVVVQLVGLPDLDLGRAAFEIGAGLGGASGVVLIGLLLVPLGLHVGTAVLTSVGARKGRTAYAAAFLGAVVIHATYNLVVVMVLG